MSNQAVGNVYQAIIEEVINSSRVDFEESGVEESVLEELRLGWQQKLSQLDVARFPWDPKPEPPAPAQTAPPASGQAHSQAQFSPQLSHPNATPADGPAQNGIKQEHGLKQENIKQEPGTSATPFPGFNLDSKNVAANRAAQQLQLQYGMRAAGSINAIQNMGQSQQQAGQGTQAADQLGQGAQPPQAQQQQPQPPAGSSGNSAGPVGNGQTDGADDGADDGAVFDGVLLRRGPSGDVNELGRVEIDRMLHAQIAARAKAMEGGGLMLPLKKASASKHQAASANHGKGKSVAGFDGVDDDDEDIDDEDAINSDLDDPEEDRDDDEVDDEGLGHIMLCMYDKVQRVKNKWKCTLKDGVLTVNGKEYVFHKATGEYEW